MRITRRKQVTELAPVEQPLTTEGVKRPPEIVTDNSTPYNDLEFTKSADQLIEAIRQQLVRIDGVEPTASRVHKIAVEIIDGRLK